MNYFSTKFKASDVNFKELILNGIPADGGLYLPQEIPCLNPIEICEFSDYSYHDIAFEVCKRFLQDQIPENDLFEIIQEAYNFSIPFEKVDDNIHVMRLDQGSSGSVKDISAILTSRFLQYFMQDKNEEKLILTATSGDSGAAIANAFGKLKNVKVIILFPENQIADRNRKQITTCNHNNIHAVAVEGDFDDCQKIIKQAFLDADIDRLNPAAIDSFNFASIIPRIIYFFFAFAQLRKGNPEDDIIFSLPAGNLGEVLAGLLAKRMGLPIIKLVIATNENNPFPSFLKTGKYQKINSSQNCLANSLNVYNPINWERIIMFYNGNFYSNGVSEKVPNLQEMRKDFYATCISDKEINQTIRDAWQKYFLLLEPNGAAAWAGLQNFLHQHLEIDQTEQLFVSLEPTHPAKYAKMIYDLTKIDPFLPPEMEDIDEKKENFSKIKNCYEAFKIYLKKII